MTQTKILVEVLKDLPRLYETEKLSADKVLLPLKILIVESGCKAHIYPYEFDGNNIYFGLTKIFEAELGYGSIAEIEEFNLIIEKLDPPMTLKEIKELYK